MCESFPSFRNFSNKENSGLQFPTAIAPSVYSSSSSSSAAKPRISGIGRAPRQNRKQSIQKPYARKASSQNVNKSSSIQRAKLRANANEDLQKAIKRGKAIRKSKTIVPPPLDLSKIRSIQEEDVDMASGVNQPVFKLRLVSDTLAPSLPSDISAPLPTQVRSFESVQPETLAEVTPISSSSASTRPEPKLIGSVPIQLPPTLKRPMIPPVLYDGQVEGSVPINYMLKRVIPYFRTVYELLPNFVQSDESLRRPPTRILTPTYHTSAGPIRRVDDMYDTLPFWYGESIPYGGLNEEMKMKCSHWGPDACLVVRQKGSLASPPTFYPIKKLVLTSQCAHFSKLASQGQALRGQSKNLPRQPSQARKDLMKLNKQYQAQQSHVRTTTQQRYVSSPLVPRKRTASPTHSPSSSTSTVVPNEGDKGNVSMQSSPTTPIDPAIDSSIQDRFAYSRTTLDGTPHRPPVPGSEAYAKRHLDLLPIYLPDPTSLPLVLLHLHFPEQSLVTQLLELEQLKSMSRADMVEYIRCIPLEHIDRLMNRILGFYSNLIELGIANENAWNSINQAWNIVYIAYQRRIWVYAPMVERYDMKLPPVIQWRTVVGVPAPQRVVTV